MRALLPAPRRTSPPRDERIFKLDQSGIVSKISSACLACKERKTKCSGQRPCAKCVAKHSECVFDIAADARRRINRARSKDISTRQRDLLRRLLETLRHGKQAQLDHLIRLCRDDISWDQLVAEICSIQDQLDLLSLPTAALPQSWTDHTSRDSVQHQSPPTDSRPALRRDASSVMSVGRLADTPIFQLTSSRRWTDVTVDDELVSHLISLYFVWEHQTAPFLDRVLFFEDFQSGKQDFCSPLLVNAILAQGSRFSNRTEVSPSPGETGHKGQRFELEAYRLWQLENHRATLPSVQALCMLSWRAAANGRDRQGRSLLTEAISLSHDLRLHHNPRHSSKKAPIDPDSLQGRLQRGRNVTAWAIRNHTTLHSTAVMKPLLLKRTFAPRTFPETDLYKGKDWWQAYPYSRANPHPTQFWCVFRYWCELCETAFEAVDRLYDNPRGDSDEESTIRLSLAEVEDYARKFDSLHASFLHHLESRGSDPDLPHFYQLRAYALTYPLILYNTLTDEADRISTHERVMKLAYQITTMTSDFEQNYGFRYIHGVAIHPLVVVTKSLMSRLEDPRSQPLLEKCIGFMIEMVDNLAVMKAVVRVYALAAQKANVRWSPGSGLDAVLARVIPEDGHCADYPVLPHDPDLLANESDEDCGALHNAGLTELLDRWADLSLQHDRDPSPDTLVTSSEH